MPPKFKTDLEKQAARTLMMDAARSLFVSKGVEAVTMREIAKQVGCSATAIYLHFADKETLIRAICDTDFMKLAGRLQQILQLPDPLERMHALGAGYATFALEHPNHYRLMFMTPKPPCPSDQSEIQQGNPEQDAYAQLKTVVKAVFDGGLFRPDIRDYELIAQTLWAGIHGVCALQICLAHDPWIDWRDISLRTQMMLETLSRGLLKDSGLLEEHVLFKGNGFLRDTAHD